MARRDDDEHGFLAVLAGLIAALIAFRYWAKFRNHQSVGADFVYNASPTDGKTLADLFNGVVNLNGAFGGGYDGPQVIVSDPLPWSI